MDTEVKSEYDSIRDSTVTSSTTSPPTSPTYAPKAKARVKKSDLAAASVKRRCISTACVACRRRKSKCDGNTPACAACSSVYGTECVYDPNSDHRRKGVYKKDIDSLKTRNSTLQTLIEAILNYPEDEVPDLVRQIRTCDSLDRFAGSIVAKENGLEEQESEDLSSPISTSGENGAPTFESQLSSKMGELRLEDGSVRFIGGTSNLLYHGAARASHNAISPGDHTQQQENPYTSWTNVTSDPAVVVHLLNMYMTWHYPFFTVLSKSLFYRDFLLGKPPIENHRGTEYCSPLLVNAMLALGCHFTSSSAARADPEDSATTGDHFFMEAKRLALEDDEYARPRLATVQALALMSVREVGCARETKGWVYSGMSFRMACDMGLNLHPGGLTASDGRRLEEEEEDARRITFWGIFLIDKCWSNYMGRIPSFRSSVNITVSKFDVFPGEDADTWVSYTDSGFNQAHAQAARTRTVALQISILCDISSDLLECFYSPLHMDKPMGRQAELKRLSDIHTRLEAWRRKLPKELEAKEKALPCVLVMHMFFHLLYIHLFRPFLKYNQTTSPLPAHVSPRKVCTQAAAMISKLMRLYKRSYGLRQIVNICVYIVHPVCTIHLLNLPEKTAKRDITHGVRHLEEMAEGWLCARRTLSVLSLQARKWRINLPEEAAEVLARTDAKFGFYAPGTRSPEDSPTPATSVVGSQIQSPTAWQQTEAQPRGGSSSHGNVLQQRQDAFPLQPVQHPVSRRDMLISSSTLQAQFAPKLAHSMPPGVNYSVVPQGQTVSQAQGRDGSKYISSGMFGGVESLLQEAQDWWMKDQSHFATGFNNWNLPAMFDASDSAWLRDAPSTGGARHPTRQNTTMSTDGSMDGSATDGGNGTSMNGFRTPTNPYDLSGWSQ